MRSHIQIPNGVLKQFRNTESNKVFYLSLKDWKIHAVTSKKLGTADDYYSTDVEELLNKEIETPYLSLANKFLEFFHDDNQHCLQISITEEERLKRFVKIALCRSELARDSVVKNSYTHFLFSDQKKHDLLIESTLASIDKQFSFLNEYKMIALKNTSVTFFVVGQNCVYSIESNNYNCYVVPVSPQIALALLPEEYGGIFLDSQDNCLGYITHSRDVELMNLAALRYEYIFNCSFIAGARKEELTNLQLFIKDHLDVLENDKKQFV